VYQITFTDTLAHAHTHAHTYARAQGRTPLDEWSARSRELYQAKHNTHTRERRPCPPAGFEPTIAKIEGPLAHALDRAAAANCCFISTMA